MRELWRTYSAELANSSALYIHPDEGAFVYYLFYVRKGGTKRRTSHIDPLLLLLPGCNSTLGHKTHALLYTVRKNTRIIGLVEAHETWGSIILLILLITIPIL